MAGVRDYLPEQLRSALVLVLLVVMSVWWLLARNPLPQFVAAQKAVPAIAAGDPREQTGERGELNELIVVASRNGRSPLMFVAPQGQEHSFRFYFAVHSLFPTRLIYVAPQPSRPQRDWWVSRPLTADSIGQLACENGVDAIMFWKTPVPSGFDSAKEIVSLPDQRSVVFLR